MCSRVDHIIKIAFSSILFISIGCKEKYVLPVTPPRQGYLVVEGFINSNGPTNIRLSRSMQLSAGIPLNELSAIVRVEDQNNNIYPLTEKGNGLYSADHLPLNSNEKYRLYIKTAVNKEYISDFSPVRKTPPIDSIAWEQTDGVQLYINTHDPQNNTRYYRWEFDETWIWHPTYRSLIKYTRNALGLITGVEDRTLEETEKLWTCWTTQGAKVITIGTSAQLSRDSIHLPLTHIPFKSVKISILYSINVKQFAISKEEFTFLQTMKKNTEQLGSVFDPQPSQISGNIHCKTDPKEIAIGFISASDAQEKRIFISNEQVQGWHFLEDCPETGIEYKPETLRLYASSLPTAVRQYNDVTGEIVAINVAGPECVDCTLRGTNIKPSFWP
jgi:uncharacterized protein YneR